MSKPTQAAKNGGNSKLEEKGKSKAAGSPATPAGNRQSAAAGNKGGTARQPGQGGKAR
jgi:hypothetical protein